MILFRDTLAGAALGAPIAGPVGSLVGAVGGAMLDYRRSRRRKPLPRVASAALLPHILASATAKVPAKRAPLPLAITPGSPTATALQTATAKEQAEHEWALTLAKLRMSRPHPWGVIGNSYVSAADIAAWLKAHNASPWEVYPDWPWHVVKGRDSVRSYLPALGGKYIYAPGSPEAVCVIDYKPPHGFDAATWYVHQDGMWSYRHVWGETPFDVLGDVLHGVDSVLSTTTTILHDALSYAQIAASVVPGIGQIVNEVIVGCETVWDVAAGMNALEIALDGAYQAGLAAVPALEPVRLVLDPAEQFLIRIAGGERPDRAAMDVVLAKLPSGPPRDLISSMLAWLLGQLHIRVA